MRTHFGYESSDPEEYIERHYCGTLASENYSVSPFENKIDCKKCLKKYDQFVKSHQEEEEYICNQMGQMAEFFKSEIKI